MDKAKRHRGRPRIINGDSWPASVSLPASVYDHFAKTALKSNASFASVVRQLLTAEIDNVYDDFYIGGASLVEYYEELLNELIKEAGERAGEEEIFCVAQYLLEWLKFYLRLEQWRKEDRSGRPH